MTDDTSRERHTPRLLVSLGNLQFKHPWRFLLVALLTLVPSAWAASHLGFRADFSELLPDSKDSVVEMRRVSARLAGASTLTVVAQIDQGSDPVALQHFVDELVPKVLALGPEWIGAVDYGVQDSRNFFEKKKLLFADVNALKGVHDDVLARYDYEIAKASDNLLDEAEIPPAVSADAIKKRLIGAAADGAPPPDHYPNGYYQNQEGTLIAVLLRTPISGKALTEELKAKVAAVVLSIDPQRLNPAMHVRYTGGLITSAEEYDAIVRDLGQVGAWGVLGVMLSVMIFFLRVRTVLIMGATLMIGLLWSFGLTRYTLGYLNSSSGFLVSIIAGNGINYGIMYMARYIEARRDASDSVEHAILVAHRDSWLPTLASGATAMLAYGSLIVTDFRGFKHFGIIGSYAMMICWLTTYLFLPAMLVASERVWPSFRAHDANAKPNRARGYYGVIFAKVSLGVPRTVAVTAALIGLASGVLSIRYFMQDPIEYDMTKVRNVRKDNTTAGELSGAVDDIVGRIGQDGMAIMTDRLDQVRPLEVELDKRYDAAPAAQKPFEKVVTIFSLLPADQEAKIPLINEMRDRIVRGRNRGFISDQQWRELSAYLPAEPMHPISIDDLPEQVARAFTEKDGTRGRIVYIVPKEGFSVWDAKYLMRWADSFRYTKLPNGDVIKGSGRAVIFADMIKTIGEDAPKAIAVSALGSILVILLAFRGHKQAWGVFVPWLFGVTGLIAFLDLSGSKLNFLNFVAVPITIGIGAEYAHNLMQRYKIEGRERLAHVVTETGGAVVLCSMTTTIGYLALLLSINKGIVSFGLAGAVGEITCLMGAVLVLPAFLAWRGQRAARQVEAKGPPREQAA